MNTYTHTCSHEAMYVPVSTEATAVPEWSMHSASRDPGRTGASFPTAAQHACVYVCCTYYARVRVCEGL